MADVKFDRSISRPLSEISENEDLRRMSARVSSYSSSVSLKGGGATMSRPVSEVLDDSKRVSLSLPVHTITLNLADYTGTTPVAPKATLAPATTTATHAIAPTSSPSTTSLVTAGTAGKRKSLPSAPRRPAESQSATDDDAMQDVDQEVVVDLTEEQDGVSPLFMATRAALRPTPLGGADLTSGGASSINSASPPSTASPSLDLVRSPSESSTVKPAVKAKPGWLRRASMTPSLRSKARSPAVTSLDLPPEPTSPHFSTSTPPALPPRKFPAGPMDTASPEAGPSSVHDPTPLSLRDHNGGAYQHTSHHSQSLRDVGRRWRTSGGVSRSSSNNSIASTASTANHQRFPSTATRVLGHAGKAVSSTWNRARGVGSSMSISSMATLNPVRGMEPEPVSPGPLTRKLSHDTSSIIPLQEGLVFSDEVVKRRGRTGLRGRVFGRDLGLAGRAWGVFDANEERPGEDEYHRRRRQCLPAVAVRCVDYLQTVGREEEGIFRISGRSSHLARLRKEFDAGADLDLTLVQPCDLDPHAIAGTFKSYLRELPDTMIPLHIEHRIEEYIVKKKDNLDELADHLAQLPSANWFLLADVIMLIDLIPKSISVNRMSHQALMLSLGPTLRLSGEHVQLFVRHRERLFAEPPAVSPRELVDFGDEEIPPLSPVYHEINLPNVVTSAPVAPPLPKRPAPKVSKRPSFGNLLASARSSAMRKSQSDQTLLTSHHTGNGASASTPAAPPRLDLPENIQSRHVFIETDPDETEELRSSNGGHSPPVKAADIVDDHQYAAGTVAARARVYSAAATGTTPIADRFRRSSTTIDNSLGGSSLSLSSASSVSSSLGNNSGGHSSEALQPPPNPMTSIRRSPPIFFSSAVASANNVSEPTTEAATTTPPANKGVKRKDDAGAERTREGDVARDPAKRLSAGPGVLGSVAAEAEDEPMLQA